MTIAIRVAPLALLLLAGPASAQSPTERGQALRAALSLARALTADGRVAEAADLLTPVLHGVDEGRDTADWKAAEALVRETA